MSQPEKKKKDLFFSHDYTCVSRERVYLDAVTFIRASLVALLVAYGDVANGRVEYENIFGVGDGLEYRSAYVDTIQVTGFKENHDHPTFGGRHQTDRLWMIIYYSEYHGHIPDPGVVFDIDEDRVKATVQEQMSQLAVAVGRYFAGRTPPTPHPGGGLHIPFLPAWNEIQYIAPEEVPKVHQALKDEVKRWKTQEKLT